MQLPKESMKDNYGKGRQEKDVTIKEKEIVAYKNKNQSQHKVE